MKLTVTAAIIVAIALVGGAFVMAVIAESRECELGKENQR